MRQITITAPQGSASDVAKIAFAVGISEVSISEKRILDASGSETIKDSIELDVGTPVAKAFMDEFTSAPFFATCLLVIGGLIVALLTNPSAQYSDFNSLPTGVLISFAVGIAAGLATADDVGRREMIGLAATAQIAIIPAWLGLCLVRLDKDFIAEHTVGFEFLRDTVALWQPERVEKVSGVPVEKLRGAAHILGTANSLVSSLLQGVYQSNQATAAAVQINNLNLIRGMIGKPGCGVLQMNGQPTAQNTRESGANGDLPGFRNWDNAAHVADLAKVWNVNPGIIPHWAPPTHAMQIFRYCETGSIRMLWITATNPAVSLPDLPRIRSILQKESLFVIVQDAFMTETTDLADVVLPAAIWGEKTGCFTNADRTVHISHKAVEPPGEARSDLDIFLDYAQRMDLRDKDSEPLIKWSDAEGAFEAWKVRTLENWEQGRAKPNAQAALLINLVKRYPDTVERLATI